MLYPQVHGGMDLHDGAQKLFCRVIACCGWYEDDELSQESRFSCRNQWQRRSRDCRGYSKETWQHFQLLV